MGYSLERLKTITITNAFQKISDESNHKPNKKWVVVAETFIITLKNKIYN